MESEPQLPLTKVAFDDPGTRKVWKATRRRVRLKLSLWSVLLIAGLALSGVITNNRWGDGYHRGQSDLGGFVGAVALVAYLFALYTCCGALSRLRKTRSILEAYPWRSFRSVRKLSGTKEATGVPVQFRLPDGEEPGGSESTYVDGDGSVWSQSMSARNPLRWNRWDKSMEGGAWYAGDVEIGGVLALPGGRGLMTVQRRTQVLSMGGQAAKADHASILAAAPGRD